MSGFPRIFALVAAALFACSAAFAEYQDHVRVRKTFSEMDLLSDAGRVNALASDGANRIWVATPNGVSALAAATGADPERPDSLFDRAKFFPLRQDDGLLSDTVYAVGFAALGNDEHFFLGFDKGLQYGRVLSTVGLSLPPGSRLLEGDTSAHQVNDLAAGSGTLWVATNAGLREWDLGGQGPQESTSSPYSEDSAVRAVAVAPGNPDVAVYATQARVYLVESGGTPQDLDVPGGVTGIVDLAFDAESNLWVLGETATAVTVWRYAANAVLGQAGPGEEEPPPRSPEGPWPLPDQVQAEDARGLAWDPVQGAVWIAAGERGAWFATWGGEALSAWDRVRDDTGSPIPAANRTVYTVYADPAGNVWFGTDKGVEALVARFLSLDNTRYLGFGTPARVIVLDVARSGEEAVTITINGSERELKSSAPGVFTGSFVFSEEDAPGTAPVQSTPVDTVVEFRYAYDPDDPGRVLTATATWAHIEDFEDDLWIGGPCFVEALIR